MSDDEAKKWNQVPYLFELSKEKWLEFDRLHRAYVARGGKITLTSLIDPMLHDLVKMQLSDESLFDSSDASKTTRLKTEIGTLFSPQTKQQSIKELKSLGFETGTTTTEKVLNRCLEFKRRMSLISNENMPASKTIVKIFLSKIKPATVRELVIR